MEIIFHDILSLVKRIKKTKKISISQAAQMSILNTEMMEQFINLINHMTDKNFDDVFPELKITKYQFILN